MPQPPPAPAPVEDRLVLKRRQAPSVILKPPTRQIKSKGYTPVFYHSGDAGDIIASLTAVKALGGGRIQIGPDMGCEIRDVDIPRCRGNDWCFEYLRNLLEIQPYVKSVEHVPKQECVDFNLNRFRLWLLENQTWGTWHKDRNLRGYYSLADAHQRPFKVTWPHSRPWLTVDNPWPCPALPIVAQRSPRYHNDKFPWKQIVDMFGEKIAFVGLKPEWEEFCKSFGECHWFETLNALEVARLIAGSKLFIGNQSSPFWIAEGLKHNLILEMWDGDPNCHFIRPGHHHDFDGDWPRVRTIIEEAIA